MSILIKGMEMPQEKKTTLTIFPDGRVYENHGERLWGYGEDCIPWKAIPVPPHGRLIDKAECNPCGCFVPGNHGKPSIGYDDGLKVLGIIGSTPPVIPAEEGE